MKLKTFLSFIFLMGLLSSCGEKSLFEELSNGDLLEQVLIEGEVYQKYTYDNSGLVVEEQSKFHYTKYNYNGNNQLISSDSYWDESIASSSSHVLEEALNRTEWVSPENTEKDVYSTYKYNRFGELTERETRRVHNDYISFSTYSYNKQGRIERRISYHEGKESVNDDYHYDERGNLVKKERFYILDNGASELQTTTEYEFDNLHNPYLSFRGLMTPGRNTNYNNILKETYTLHFEVDDFINQVQITEYSYEYNSNGYPIRKNDSFEYVYY